MNFLKHSTRCVSQSFWTQPLKLFSSSTKPVAAKAASAATTKTQTPPSPPAGASTTSPVKKKRPLEPAQEIHPYRLDRWTDWRMKKDYLRRQCVIKLGRERMLLMTIRKNSILPIELREAAKAEIEDNLPRDSNYHRLVERCAISSRVRATTLPWRAGRFIFRHLADYNKLSGVQRGIW